MRFSFVHSIHLNVLKYRNSPISHFYTPTTHHAWEGDAFLQWNPQANQDSKQEAWHEKLHQQPQQSEGGLSPGSYPTADGAIRPS